MTKKKKQEITIRSSAAEYLTFIASTGDDEDSIEMRYEDENIWLHADACHGFSLGFSEKHKHKIKGIEKFDSISTDPHKVLDLPY